MGQEALPRSSGEDSARRDVKRKPRDRRVAAGLPRSISVTPVIRVGSWCSGLESFLWAFRRLNIPHRHVFAADICPVAQATCEHILVFSEEATNSRNYVCLCVCVCVCACVCECVCVSVCVCGYESECVDV